MSACLHSIFLTPEGHEADPVLPPRIALNLESFKLQHPGFTHTLYGDASGRDFILRHFDANTVAAFDELVPLAYKADLLRYCLLFQLGGIYADLSLNFFTPLVEDPATDRVLAFRDGYSAAPWIVSNSLLFAPAGERVFERCIHSIIEHTRTRYYGTNQLCPTGPNLLGRHMAAAMPLDRLVCGETLRINKNAGTFSWAYVGPHTNEVVAVNIKRGGGLASLGGQANDYNRLYAARAVYKSEVRKVFRWSAEEYVRRGFMSAGNVTTGQPGPGPLPAGVALTGPYVPLIAGRYKARFHVEKVSSRLYDPLDFQVDVRADDGKSLLFSSPPRRAFPAPGGTLLEADFQLPRGADDVEVRLVLRNAGSFAFQALELERL